MRLPYLVCIGVILQITTFGLYAESILECDKDSKPIDIRFASFKKETATFMQKINQNTCRQDVSSQQLLASIKFKIQLKDNDIETEADALRLVQDYLETFPESTNKDVNSLKLKIKLLTDNTLDVIQKEIKQLASGEKPNTNHSLLGKEAWSISSNEFRICPKASCSTSNEKETVSFKEPLINAGCFSEPITNKPDCGQLYEEVKGLWIVALAMHSVNASYTAEGRSRIAEVLENYDYWWKAYREKTQLQYPHEQWINYIFMHSPYCKGYLPGDREPRRCLREDSNGSPIGLARIPNYRLFFLHPEPTISYAEDEIDGDQIKWGVVVQWIGFQNIHVEGKSLKNPWGISAVTAFSDNPTIDDSGHGFMIHYGKGGLSITDHGGDIVYMLNFDLMSAIWEKDNSYLNNKLGGWLGN